MFESGHIVNVRHLSDTNFTFKHVIVY